MKEKETQITEIFSNTELNASIRTIVGEDSEVWFVGKDIAEALGYKNPAEALNEHVDDDDRKALTYKAYSKTEKASLWNGNDFSDKTVINESGMYSLIFGSKLESAKKFKRWITKEVLPSLRKNDKPTDAQQVTINNTPANCIFNLGDVDIKDRDGEFWFCARDVADMIEYKSDTNQWNKWLDDEDKLTVQNARSGQNRNMTYISESALYRVLIKTDAPKAKPFERWVTKTVLPSLRKNGEYKMPSTDSEKFQMEKEMMVVDFTAKLLNMNDDGKIKMMRKVCEMHSLPGTLLPTYTPKTEETQCLANLLDGRMSSRAFNNMLLSLGYVRKVENQGKPFYNITEKGLPYGENMKNAYSPNDKTVCRWYASKFEELYSRVFEEMKQKSLFRQ